ADVVGDELPDRTPSGLWPSDHGGVVATLGLHVRPVHGPKKVLLRTDSQDDQHRIHRITVPALEIDPQPGEGHGFDGLVGLGPRVRECEVSAWETWEKTQ